MSNSKDYSGINTPLPPCEGPKLHAFPCEDSSIAWGKRLDDHRDGASRAQGAIFEVNIESRVYALKVFKFYDPYSDDKGGIRDSLAIKCHGYLYLSKSDERWLTKMGVDLGANVLDDDLRQALGHGGRVRAIVKDIAPEQHGVSSRTLAKVLRRVKVLNELNIINKDIRLENFRGGCLVDFGSSWTRPHIIFDALSEVAKRDSPFQDLVMFDEMIEEEGIKTKLKALPNIKYREKLRPRADKIRSTD
ncbi:kinetochore Sim4 complex subunit FTA2-domain-containing protein [Apiospora arundinis]|uniref:Kinetochore Sim4 complex subunit FTA2-domain-containing protein n=1 Tax=Apiospora arundinis TaxID=335852 RepID=A0ABR2I9W3_9PEZI